MRPKLVDLPVCDKENHSTSSACATEPSAKWKRLSLSFAAMTSRFSSYMLSSYTCTWLLSNLTYSVPVLQLADVQSTVTCLLFADPFFIFSLSTVGFHI